MLNVKLVLLVLRQLPEGHELEEDGIGPQQPFKVFKWPQMQH